ncbi:MarR family winged helix-turn-helix transcriptional regulator [Actibacterium sp. 188UL27-1]|uniref:MarR family winged helix-turn-helix transcriptional regulator n=1 Tax=Actibacterium sp. 188UL27-1 TaxID=2786961 RepID=UPI00195688E7|nr:MarR family transcriptional regulator [Actibacterium sp. 188UL27-1]MBM7066437.1 MarR family transcriptional regulator [Actibacterium sp. 188UL27-1]
MAETSPDDALPLYFRLFNEIGIIEQLSRALLEAQLPAGMLVSHFSVLNHLIRVKDGRTPLELARAFQMPKTTMTHTLGGLHKHQLVETRPNPEDKRSKCIWITDAGRAFREDAIAAMAPDMGELAAHMEAGIAQDLVSKLTDLRIYLDESRIAKTRLRE